jgi:hypothetical protein
VTDDMSTTAVPRTGTRSRRLATAARVAAIVGIVVCLVLFVGLWLGRGAVVGAVDDLSTTVDSAFARAGSAATQVQTRLDTAAASAADVATQASQVAANPVAPPDALAGVAEKVGQLADAYRTVRTRYSDVRENLTNAVTSIQRVTRFIPGVQAPDNAGDRLQTLDSKLQSIDDTLTGIFPAIEAGGPTGTVAAAVADKATTLSTTLSAASAAVASLSASIDQLHSQATPATNTLKAVVTIAAAALTLFLVWILVLNLALWRLGQVWRRDAAIAAPTAMPPTGTRPADVPASATETRAASPTEAPADVPASVTDTPAIEPPPAGG